MEKIRIIGGRNGRLWPAVLRRAQAGRDAGRPLIVYVPEQLTLQAERDLISGLELPGLLDIDVISPKKLRMQVREQAGGGTLSPLDDAGKTMAVQWAMTETAEDLAYYRGMGALPGAVSRVKEAIGELLESGMTGGELAAYARENATGAEQARLGDLARIWEAYDGLVRDRFEDEKTAWTDMVTRLDRSGMWDGTEILVYGFDSIRPDTRELILRAAPRAASVSVFLMMDRETAPDGQIFSEPRRSAEKLAAELRELGLEAAWEWADRKEPAGQREELAWLEEHLFAREDRPRRGDPGKTVSLYAGANPTEETEDIAGTLRTWHEEGIAWQRMAVALPGNSGLDAALRARLALSGIPFFCAEKTPAASHGVCRLLTGALECISEGYGTDAVMRMARSGFSTLNGEEALALENYAEAHGIDRKLWQTPFTRGDDAEGAEELRRRLLAPVEHLREELKKARTAAESAEAVVRFLEEENCWNSLKAREERLLEKGMYREAVVDRQVWQLLMKILDQLWSLLGSRRASIREMKQQMETALDGAEISVLPERESGVVIGEVGHMLPGETDALILAGASEGIMAVPESGWITDRERETMEQTTGKEIGLSRQQRSLIRRYDYYRTLSMPRLRLRITRSLWDEGGRVLPEDGLVGMIRRLFPDLKEEGSALESPAARRPETPLKTLEGIGGFLEAVRAGQDVPDRGDWEKALVALLHSERYGAAAGEMIRAFRGEGGGQAIAPETARRLFMTDQVSISRLERFAGCPYRHFIDYGLRPVRRETFTFENSDEGTFFHAALDGYMRRAAEEPGWPDLNRERADRVMDGVLRELTEEWEEGPLKDSAVGVWHGETLTRRVRYAAWALTRFAANSDFRTIATEQVFGSGDGAFPPLILQLRDGSRAAVRGTIDRIDRYENGEGIWLRVVDNKSSDKKPDPARMESGEQLQLMIYLQAAVRAFPGARPAGALFFPVRDREIDTPETDPEAIEDMRLSRVRMKGLVTAEADVVRAMDRDRAPYSVDQVFNKDGSVSKRAPWALDEGTLRGLMDAAEEKAAELCAEIREGHVEAAPRGEGEDSACAFCEYRTICHGRPEDSRPRDDGITWRSLAGKNTLHDGGK